MFKRMLFVAALICVAAGAMAQAPSQFRYQAVLRDAGGNILSNLETVISISIIEGSLDTGHVVFNEEHQVTTSPEGLFSINIGSVNPEDLKAIDWSSGVFHITLSVDGTYMGGEQLFSVPYALYSASGGGSDFMGCSIFDDMFNAMDQMLALMDHLLSSMDTTSTEVLQLISKLSDDIGLMSEQIGIMADRILAMAGEIGVMADRIVATEELMAQLTLDLASVASDIAEINANTSGACGTAALITDTGTGPLETGVAPQFSITGSATEYLIYVASSLTMDANTVSVLIRNPAELTAQWPNLQSLATGNKIYIAVKTIEGNDISVLSNILTYDTNY